MEFDFIWWHWIVGGLIWIVLELFSGTWIMLSFAIASVVVGLVTKAYGLALSTGLGIWSVVAIGLTYFFFRHFNKKEFKTFAGQTKDKIGTRGIIIEGENKIGVLVRFNKSVLGSKVWNVSSLSPLIIGDEVVMTGVEGQVIIVEKKSEGKKI